MEHVDEIHNQIPMLFTSGIFFVLPSIFF